MQLQNDERYQSNLENIKFAMHEANNSVLNPPIKEGYDHTSFKPG